MFNIKLRPCRHSVSSLSQNGLKFLRLAYLWHTFGYSVNPKINKTPLMGEWFFQLKIGNLQSTCICLRIVMYLQVFVVKWGLKPRFWSKKMQKVYFTSSICYYKSLVSTDFCDRIQRSCEACKELQEVAKTHNRKSLPHHERKNGWILHAGIEYYTISIGG